MRASRDSWTSSRRSIERCRSRPAGFSITPRRSATGTWSASRRSVGASPSSTGWPTKANTIVARYGAAAARRTPPIRRMLAMGIPVGAGTDATRVASYNPWVALRWLVTGKTVGGLPLYETENRLSRDEACRLYTAGSSWFSGEEGRKGAIAPGQLADVAALSADYFSIPEDQIAQLESVLTLVGGRIVHASGEFAQLAPPLPPVVPDSVAGCALRLSPVHSRLTPFAGAGS